MDRRCRGGAAALGFRYGPGTFVAACGQSAWISVHLLLICVESCLCFGAAAPATTRVLESPRCARICPVSSTEAYPRPVSREATIQGFSIDSCLVARKQTRTLLDGCRPSDARFQFQVDGSKGVSASRIASLSFADISAERSIRSRMSTIWLELI
jgi:hypothetical protein